MQDCEGRECDKLRVTELKKKFNILFGEEENLKEMLEGGSTDLQKKFLENLNTEEEQRQFQTIINSYNKVSPLRSKF